MFLKNILFCLSSNQMDFVFSLSPARPYLSYDTSANQAAGALGLSCAGCIVHVRIHFASEMGFGGRNRANQAVRPSPLYLYSYSFFDV